MIIFSEYSYTVLVFYPPLIDVIMQFLEFGILDDEGMMIGAVMMTGWYRFSIEKNDVLHQPINMGIGKKSESLLMQINIAQDTSIQFRFCFLHLIDCKA